MADPQLQLPTIQNWSCHSCSGCCRQHLVEITEAERQRILDQNWTAADGIPAGTQCVVQMSGRLLGKPRYRLGQQPDGACVFLNEQGLCRIHAKFGERAKPLACLIYPYAFHPAGRKLAVSLRFSCPSVVRNAGKPVSEQARELARLAADVVPAGARDVPPPDVAAGERLDWPDFLKVIRYLDESLAPPDTRIAVKLLRCLAWMGLVGQSKFDVVKGARLDEFLEILVEASASEVPDTLADLSPPSRLGQLQFRMLVALYARKDTLADREAGLLARWRLLRAATRFARGKGTIPPLQDAFKEVPFAALEDSFGALNAEMEEVFTRYFRVKLQGLHFCGRAYYDVPLVEGFQSLVLMFPAVLWLARWLAAGEGRRALTTDDVSRALSIADHNHGYSPSLGQSNSRRRVRLLAQTGDIAKLCAWYGR